jgi:hypothetical protein
MKQAVNIGTGAMMYISSFIKTGSAIQKSIEGYTNLDRQHGHRISLLPLFFFQIKETG